MVYNTTQHPPPPPATHCLYILYVYFGKGGEVREKAEGQQYTSIVPLSMGPTVHKLGRKYQPWGNVFPVYKISCTHAAKSVNRSILKKSRHWGFVCLYSSFVHVYAVYCTVEEKKISSDLLKRPSSEYRIKEYKFLAVLIRPPAFTFTPFAFSNNRWFKADITESFYVFVC